MPGMVDDKQVKTSPAAAGPAARKDGLLLLAKAWVGVTAVAWGGSAALLVSFQEWLGGATVRVGSAMMSPGGLAVGALLAAGIAVLVFRKFGENLRVAKPGLGRSVRLSTYLGVAAMTLFGCYGFYLLPPITSAWWRDLFPAAMIFGKALSLKPILFPTVAIASAVMLACHLLLNRETWVDFQIETEGEMRKVSWPARKEYLGSSVVVVVVIAVVSIFLHFTDLGLSWVMRNFGIGF